jgi:hypothetical protein
LPRRPATARPEAPKPLTFAEAQAQLTQSSDREDVATTVLRYAVGKWRRCLLLSVQGSLVTGWHGMGRGVRDAAVRRIGVALREGNTFRLVRDTRSHYVGPVKRDTAMNVFYRLLGADKRPEPPFPKTSVILPLLVRGKVVHLLYLDNGPDQLTTPDVGELMILAQSVRGPDCYRRTAPGAPDRAPKLTNSSVVRSSPSEVSNRSSTRNRASDSRGSIRTLQIFRSRVSHRSCVGTWFLRASLWVPGRRQTSPQDLVGVQPCVRSSTHSS